MKKELTTKLNTPFLYCMAQSYRNHLIQLFCLIVLVFLIILLDSRTAYAQPSETTDVITELRTPENTVPTVRITDQRNTNIQEEEAEKPTKKLNYWQHLAIFGIATMLAVIGCMAQVIKRFHRFIGLGVFTNIYTFLLLVFVFCSTALIYLGIFISDGFFFGYQLVEETTAPWVGMFGSPIVGNLATLLGRLAGAVHLDTGSTSEVKELAKAKSSNILLELIRDAIGYRMDKEVVRMTHRYDWELIKETTAHLIENEIALKRLPAEEGYAAREYILAFEGADDERRDRENKYQALHRAIQVSSFRQLQMRLASAGDLAS